MHQTATHCNTLQQHTNRHVRSFAPHCHTPQHCNTHCDTLLHTASHCITLHHTATYCNNKPQDVRDRLCTLQHTFQHTATRCNNTPADMRHGLCISIAMQHTPTHCNTLQHDATHGNTHYNTLQHTATHCNTEQLHTNRHVRSFVYICRHARYMGDCHLCVCVY